MLWAAPVVSSVKPSTASIDPAAQLARDLGPRVPQRWRPGIEAWHRGLGRGKVTGARGRVIYLTLAPSQVGE